MVKPPGCGSSPGFCLREKQECRFHAKAEVPAETEATPAFARQNPAIVSPPTAHPTSADSPASIFIRFLKFGALAWGGPAAQIAMIKHECVDQEHWISEESFKKLLAVYQVLPGPRGPRALSLGRNREPMGPPYPFGRGQMRRRVR
jgi:chromate transporter